jgi:hypothetical protein
MALFSVREKFMTTAILVATTLFSWLAQASTSDEVMFRANLQRTGIYATLGIKHLRGVKWKFRTERVIEAWFSSPTVTGGVVYFGSDDSYLYAVDARTGKLKWRFKTGGVVYSSPCVVNGVVYFDGDSRRRRGSDHLPLLTMKLFILETMTGISMHSIPTLDNRDGQFG